MWYILLLILLGVLFLVVEMLLLPGVSIGLFLSMACYGGAIWYAFDAMGVTAGIITVAVVLALTLVSVIISLRAKTWQRLALKQEIDSTSMPKPESEVALGSIGVAVSRLAPMGKVSVAGKVYEAKSVDVFIDQREAVEVVGYENFNIVVKRVNN